MRILVIHPADPSTDFLKVIYEGLDCNIINTNISHKSIKEQIRQHDRILIMGHGYHGGLFGFNRIMLDSTFVDLLRKFDNNVYIWCNADKFVERYDLKGFYTGMIISEMIEALQYSILPSDEQIDESNKLFAQSIKNSITSEPYLLKEQVQKEYSQLENPVINFNQINIYSR
jgi:phosphomannomutase